MNYIKLPSGILVPEPVVIIKENNIIEYAYKEEVLEYIKTGTFEYNEDITF